MTTVPDEPPEARRRVERRLAGLLLVVAAALGHSFAQENEKRTLALLDALAAGRLAIDPSAPGMLDLSYVPPPGPPPAPELVARGVAPVTTATRAGPGHYYAGGPPGLAFTLAPADAVVRRVADGPARVLLLTILGAGAPLALGTVLVRRAALADGATPDAATLTAIAFATGTIALPFAARLYAHSLVVALLAGSLLLLLRDPTPRRCALAGALAGWAVVCDYVAVLQTAALLGLAFARGGPRGGAAFALGGLPAAALLAAYHTACFGAPWSSPYLFRADPGTQQALEGGSWGFTGPRPGLVVALLLGDERGVLLTQPVALVGLAGLVDGARRRRPGAALALGVVALTFLANASRASNDWDAGHSYGARYAINALPFLALGLPRGLELLGRAGPWVLAGSALCAGLGAVSDWGRYVWTSVDFVWWLGPRARGLELLLLGPAPRELAAALVSAVGLAVLAALAAWVLGAGASLRVALLPVAVVVAAGAHGVVQVARAGARPELLRREVGLRELARAIEDARTIGELQPLGWRAQEAGDPALLRRAVERAHELDPDGDGR